MAGQGGVADVSAVSEDSHALPPGLGDEDFPGFPTDICPEEMPDLSGHYSTLADVLKADPTIYGRLRERRTSLEVGLARCIKVGIDNRGHQMVRAIGLIAGDEECYDVFRELFDPVMRRHLGGSVGGCEGNGTEGPREYHLTNLGRHVDGLTAVRADATGRYVVSSQVRCSRSLRGFRFPPAMSRSERHEVERLVARALTDVQDQLKGEYLPLRGSDSYAPRPGGMSPQEEKALQAAGLLFEAPDATVRLCSGVGRHWPEGRGVFAGDEGSLAVWVNEQEHIRVLATHAGDDVQLVFRETARALDALAGALREGCDRFGQQVFAHSSRLGYLTSSPANVGTAMQVSMTVRLPMLSRVSARDGGSASRRWRAWCSAQRVQIRSVCDDDGVSVPGVFELSTVDRLGVSEVDLVNLLVQVVSRLTQMEQLSEAGHPITDLLAAPVEVRSPATASAVGRAPSQEVAQKAVATLYLGLTSGALADALGQVMRGSPAAQVRAPSQNSVAAGYGDCAADLVKSVIDKEIEKRAWDERARSISFCQVEGDAAEDPEVAIFAIDPVLEEHRLSIDPGKMAADRVALQSAYEAAAEAVATAVRSSLKVLPDKAEAEEAGRDGPEGLRARVLDALVEGVRAGTLERALVGSSRDGAEAEEAGRDEPEGLRAKVFDALAEGVCTGTLERALVGSSRDGAEGPLLKAKQSHALRRMSEGDRRIGELVGMIKATERQIGERSALCVKLEESIVTAEKDLQHVEMDIEWHRLAMKGAVDRSEELEAGCRRLLGELDGHRQKLKLTLGGDGAWNAGLRLPSVRSDWSTATGAS